MLLTSRLWKVFKDPPTLHPLFWRTIYRSGATQFATRDYRVDMFLERAVLSYFGAVLVIWTVVGTRFATSAAATALNVLFLNLLFLLLALPILLTLVYVLRYTLLNGTISGLMWALRISDYIAQERAFGGFDLVWVAPPGGLGASMAVCTGCLYRKATIHQFRKQYQIVCALVLVCGLLTLLGLDARYVTIHTSLRAFGLTILLVIVAVLYIDAVHSLIMGSLLGMLIPTFTQHRLDARFWTISIYLSIQIFTFALGLFVSLFLMPALYSNFQVSGWLADLSPFIIGLGLFYITREGIIALLWHLLAMQFNADPSEMRFWP